MVNYSENNFSSLFELQTSGFEFPSLEKFYLISRIPEIKDFYDGCLMMSIKSSNNQEIIDRMPFNKYLKLSVSLNKYIEMENKANGGESTDASEQMNQVKNNSEEMMNKVKSDFKMPSFSKFKL